ncbi:acyl-CoA dehydrogenase family protein [Streptomyces sp. NPDC006997]|uniref:acyl-CoA dehydrogenase family protein n=1 Tax=Streptomyces sp. NPDC006997 TaxID=3155356 RepID=UPI0033EB3A3C
MTDRQDIPRPATWLTEAERAWRARVAAVAEKSVAPRAAAMDRAAALAPDLVGELRAAGLMAIHVPERYGGRGGGLFDVIVAIEELAQADPAVAVFVDVQNALVTQALLSHGSGDQKRTHLTALAGGGVGAFALSEELAGSDALALATTARPEGDGFVLDGTKRWITNAAEADLFLVLARVPERGLTAFLVDRRADGLTVGDRTAKMGIRATSTCEVRLDGVHLSRRDVLGAVGRGDVVAVQTLDVGKLGIAAQLVGLAQGALTAAVAHARDRVQFGQPIGAYQGVRFPLARVSAELEAARTQLYSATRLAEHGAGGGELTRAAAVAKYLASEVAERAASLAVETLGGQGYAEAGGVEKLYRDAKVGKIYEGTSNMQFRAIAAHLLRGVPEHTARASHPGDDPDGAAHPGV